MRGRRGLSVRIGACVESFLGGGVRGLVYLDSVPSGGEVVFGLFPRESGPGGHSPRTPGGQGRGGWSFLRVLSLLRDVTVERSCFGLDPARSQSGLACSAGHHRGGGPAWPLQKPPGRGGRGSRGGGRGPARSLGHCSLGRHLSPCLLAARIHFRCCESRPPSWLVLYLTDVAAGPRAAGICLSGPCAFASEFCRASHRVRHGSCASAFLCRIPRSGPRRTQPAPVAARPEPGSSWPGDGGGDHLPGGL